MYKIKIFNQFTNKRFQGQFEALEDAQKWIAKQSIKKSKPWGLPERNVKMEDASEFEKLRAVAIEEIDGIEYLKVPSDFKVEIIDEDKDIEFFNQRQKVRRARAYPSWNKVNEAILENMEGRPELLEEVLKEREIVRNSLPYKK